MPTYSQKQSVFALSVFSNLGSTITGTVDHIEAALASTIDAQLVNFQPEIGTWTVVWGPAVFQAPGSIRADNVMYVARGGPDTATDGQLVVAVAGTDPYSAHARRAPSAWNGDPAAGSADDGATG
jgi:hypothetical protein